MSEEGAGSVKSGSRILDVLEYMAGQDRAISLAELVADLAIPKSSALMLLRTLVAKHYVERDVGGYYRLDRMFRAADGDWVGGRIAVLRRLVRPFTKELAKQVQETVVVGVLTPDFEVKVVEKARSPREVRYEIELGDKYPAYCTSMGRAILGFMAPETLNTYLDSVPRTKCTTKTVIEREALLEIFAQVRRQGYAFNIEEHVDGASSIAAPLMDDTGHILGSLNVGCVTANFRANRETIRGHLIAAATRFNAELAHRIAAINDTESLAELQGSTPVRRGQKRRNTSAAN